MLEIATLEKELLSQKIENYKHKNYLSNFVQEHKVILLALLIPAFIIGWQSAKRKPVRLVGKQLTNLVVLTAVATVRKKLWNTFTKAFSLD
jgi:hypothetical protein